MSALGVEGGLGEGGGGGVVHFQLGEWGEGKQAPPLATLLGDGSPAL